MSPRRQVVLTLVVLAVIAIGAITAATIPDDYKAALAWAGLSGFCLLVFLLGIAWAARPLSDDERREQELDEQLARHRAYPRQDREGASA